MTRVEILEARLAKINRLGLENNELPKCIRISKLYDATFIELHEAKMVERRTDRERIENLIKSFEK